MPNYSARVSLSYEDLSGVFTTWSESCEKMVVYQHDADDEVNRTHCHLLMLECKYKTPEALKRQLFNRLSVADKGNSFWSWKADSDIKFIVYMSKGKLRPVFVKNFSPAELEELRLQWKEPTPKGNLLTEKKESTKTKYDLIEDMMKEINDDDVDGKCSSYLADYLVRVVLKVLRKNRIVIGRYKVREYRDALLYYKPNLEQKFLNFVNEDFKSDY